MFIAADRETLRARLIETARVHSDIETAALLGSAARGEEDRWSDIDLALGLGPGVDPKTAADTWTELVEQTNPVVDHLDIEAAGGLYRVLLLASTLQVDLSFWPHGQLPASNDSVHVLFGDTASQTAPAQAAKDLSSHVRTSWLYALHVRCALGRGRTWQALWMLDGIRNHVITLLCLRHGLPSAEGRGVDRLPPAVLKDLSQTLPGGLDPSSITLSFRRLTNLLAREAEQQALPLPTGLWTVLDELVGDGEPVN